MKILNLEQSMNFLEKNKIKFAQHLFATKEVQVLKCKLPFPWAMKAVSNEIVHKTEFNAIRLNIHTLEQAGKAFRELSKLPGFKAALVQEQMQGQELIIGGKRDAQFGPTVLVGYGGIFTEILRDFSLRICPLQEKDAESMIQELKALPLLKGARKQPPANLKMVKDLILAVSKVMSQHSEVLELDLNPVLASPKNACAVDARVVVE